MSKNDSCRFYGIKYWNGEMMEKKIAKIPGVKKRGIWKYDVNFAVPLNKKDVGSVFGFAKKFESEGYELKPWKQYAAENEEEWA